MGVLARIYRTALVAGAAALGGAGAFGGAGALGGAGAANAATPPGGGYRQTFDNGTGGLVPITRDGGTVRTVPGPSGAAVQFPAVCRGRCPRAILEAPGTGLDPGTGPISFGASVLLSPGQTTVGSNVVQKGTWSMSGQWKLQVDGVAGQPSCALMGHGSRRMYTVTAPVSVADGRWHQVTCTRVGGTLTVTVDGSHTAAVPVPAGLAVRSEAPLRIGGNGVGVRSDRFHGAVDDVFVVVGRAEIGADAGWPEGPPAPYMRPGQGSRG